jgi:3-oxoacyl-[acyl-carrier-protein] synthase-3
VGAEVFSRILDWQDRGTCVLFGDGAGAVVLAATATPGVRASVLHADGSHAGILSTPGHVCGGKVTGDPFLRMDGQGYSSWRYACWMKSRGKRWPCAK